ncbi:YrhK family protein [Paenibacillus sp. TRM 82003]|uniref:YrhK family protein n=1 Tax=Kineococcus sp. TRM81007 TaxID=2925831 RepID=UPI001F563DD9|nr:YrhK family protein [Kineococcus sp. TRM81007]MCI2240001.1 YrhK family protein [Kineococcus sp. TRM81007]MCI3925694.1 YrhK family protein [Paenibacillus sp. TRM 82003]
MELFDPGNPNRSEAARRLCAALEVWYTAVDFAAAALFVVGSVLFLWERTTTAGTWSSIAGSVCFALEPTLRLVRELRMAEVGDTEDLAQRAP